MINIKLYKRSNLFLFLIPLSFSFLYGCAEENKSTSGTSYYSTFSQDVKSIEKLDPLAEEIHPATADSTNEHFVRGGELESPPCGYNMYRLYHVRNRHLEDYQIYVICTHVQHR